jgi:hypothetical protein
MRRKRTKQEGSRSQRDLVLRYAVAIGAPFPNAVVDVWSRLPEHQREQALFRMRSELARAGRAMKTVQNIDAPANANCSNIIHESL